jgi:hypothetical protein
VYEYDKRRRKMRLDAAVPVSDNMKESQQDVDNARAELRKL